MNDDMLELRMWRDGNIMHENCIEDMNKLRKESKDIIENLVIHILETNETTKINTPPHECEFITEPERGKCSFCETWGSAMMLVYPNQIEEEKTNV